MSFDLHWIRRRQRALAKAVLALVVLAWLQVAAVPCLMADDLGAATATVAGTHACPYCPGTDGPHHPQGGDAHGACAYPHGPQVDARVIAVLASAVPVVPVAMVVDDRPYVTTSAHAPPAPLVPQTSLTDSYCRRIE